MKNISIYKKIYVMVKNNIMEIVNDEISNFDFLGNDEYLKEQEIIDLLSNDELQKQFISDSLLNKNDKIKILNIIDSNLITKLNEPNTDDEKDISLEYSIHMEYNYDSMKDPLDFNLEFESDKIDVENNNIDWKDINVSIYTINGDEIEFNAFKSAPQNIQILFIQQYIQDFIEGEISKIT